MVELRHYAAEPIVLDRSRTYDPASQAWRGKPHGLWVSVPGADDWPSWCRLENFCLDQLQVEHVVTLTERANVLHVGSVAEMYQFHQEWRSYFDDRTIDWGRVAASYDGIVIAPYQWAARRLDLPWYYGWDVASGCIWNLDAVESLTVATHKREEVAS